MGSRGAESYPRSASAIVFAFLICAIAFSINAHAASWSRVIAAAVDESEPTFSVFAKGVFVCDFSPCPNSRLSGPDFSDLNSIQGFDFLKRGVKRSRRECAFDRRNFKGWGRKADFWRDIIGTHTDPLIDLICWRLAAVFYDYSNAKWFIWNAKVDNLSAHQIDIGPQLALGGVFRAPDEALSGDPQENGAKCQHESKACKDDCSRGCNHLWSPIDGRDPEPLLNGRHSFPFKPALFGLFIAVVASVIGVLFA
jgi:hypothetical protein